jgi:hypothetical protein
MDDNNEVNKSIAERLLKPGLGLGPFAYRVTLEKKLAEERDSKKFIKEISSQFCDLPNPMEDSTLQYLYDICLDALVDKMLVDKARKLIRPAGWSKSRRALRALIKSLRSYQPRDIEERLRTQLSAEAPSPSQSAAKELLIQLAQLDQVCDWWEGFAAWDSWGAFYRGHVWALDKFLKSKGYKLKDHRAAIIAGVVKAMGLKRRVSTEAIAKSLLREAKAPRRFVFSAERSVFTDLS